MKYLLKCTLVAMLAYPAYGYGPGAMLKCEYPEMPPTLFSQMIAGQENDPARVTVRIPQNYTPEGSFPMAIYLGGNHGGNGYPNVPFNDEFRNDTVCVFLPLFKANYQPGGSVAISQSDSTVLWQCFEPMINWVYQQVPNIDRERTFMGGFSNGAHATAALLNRPNAANEIASLIQHFYLYEGGTSLNHWDVVDDRSMLFVQGGNTGNRMGSVYQAATAAGVDTDLFSVPNTGHVLSPVGLHYIHEWTGTVPEPTTVAMLAVGTIALLRRRRA